jgi:ribosomal-protein-alanine N-acetyltransferase
LSYRFRPMEASCARAIAGWHYEGIYAFYDMEQDIEDLQELLDPHSWIERYYAVTDEGGDLVGFFCLERERDTVVIGLGLRPDLTGRGQGQAFLEAGLEFAREIFGPAPFRLQVGTFNQRAIRVYRKAGFQDAGVFLHETNGGQYEFLRMVKENDGEQNQEQENARTD